MRNSTTHWTKDDENPGSIFHELVVLPTLYPEIARPEYMQGSHTGPVIYPQPRSQQLANGIYAVNDHLAAGKFVVPDLGNIYSFLRAAGLPLVPIDPAISGTQSSSNRSPALSV